MTPTRATVYVGLASVLVAWLAGAAGVSVTPHPPPPQSPPSAISVTQAIANDVQAQTARLRGRLAAAPSPREPLRNPFAFSTRAIRASRGALPIAQPAAPEPAQPAEPLLQLIGVAEQETPTGTVRTAMITPDSDELFMLVAGDTLGGRYRVKTVGADFVELTDLVTSATRRLTMR